MRRNTTGFVDCGTIGRQIARERSLEDPEVLQRYLGERFGWHAKILGKHFRGLGIPVRASPPGTVGDVDEAEEVAMLLDPEPHIPDVPEVASMSEVVGIPDVVDIPDEADIPEEADMSDDAAVAGAAAPTASPPPSKVAVDPNIPDDEVPRVEHDVPLAGIEAVPVTMGAGLTRGTRSPLNQRGCRSGKPPNSL